MRRFDRTTRTLALCGALALSGQLGAHAQGPTGTSAAEPTGNVCIDCHVKEQGKLSEVVEEWRGSIHAEVGVSCEGCHKGDANDERFAHSRRRGFAGVPRLREVPYFCGKCHAEIKEKHLGSPHGKQGLPHCVACHGNHAIERPDPAKIIIEEPCSVCHTFDPPQRALASLAKAHELLSELDDSLNGLDHLPGAKELVLDLQKKLKLDKIGVASTFHSFLIGDIEAIGANAERIRKVADKLRARETQRRENLDREIPFVITFVSFCLFASILGFFVFHGKGTVDPAK